ncbi:MAG TPA: NmrA family NAD(P)-binding protein [Rickettsiales bacterium]|nr:NmrA family NAD(P)-binding protein [Rickettsiales bacterium]
MRHIITGATGHVGLNVVKALLAKGEQVTALTHSVQHKSLLESLGADVAVCDISHTARLTEIFRLGESVFMLNPPGDVAQDSVALELDTVHSLTSALKSSGVRQVVAESAQGAQKGVGIGDLGVLYEMEERLRQRGGPCRITRAAYYMSNWDALFLNAQKTRKIPSFYPKDFQLEMVAPVDLGKFNADQLSSSFDDFRIYDLSGPQPYTVQDVADEASRHFGVKVEVDVIPRAKWQEAYKTLGFSAEAARSYAKMTEITLEKQYDVPRDPQRGTTTLSSYFDNLMEQEGSGHLRKSGTH